MSLVYSDQPSYADYFSSAVKAVIGEALAVARDLGADKVSTIHFFIANCQLEELHNPKEFLFSNEEEYEQFYSSQRAGMPKEKGIENALSLTKEAEETIRRSLKLRKVLKSEEVEPVHLLWQPQKHPDRHF
jgi:hypothetical protein